MTSVLLSRALVLLLTAGLLVACGGAPASPAPATETPAPAARLAVVASTTVHADLVRQVGGGRVTVHSVIPPGRDVHTFEPSPSDVTRLAGADLLVINGLGLDDWLEELLREIVPDVPVVALAENLDGVDYLERGAHEDEEDAQPEEDEHGINPHLWLDAANTRLYVEKLTATLVALDPDGRPTYEGAAADFDARLAELDEWISDQLAGLPEHNRRVVSFHDAFPYFARAYEVEIIGVVVESPGQEPSAGEVARLIAAIREAGVRAILTEVQFSDRLAQTIAEDTGVNVIQGLYSDSLGDPPLDTYESAMHWNVEQIVAGLR